MTKLTLDLESLTVESFHVDEEANDAFGTIHAAFDGVESRSVDNMCPILNTRRDSGCF